VAVLGPIEVYGWAEAPSRRRVTELLVYLSLHGDRPVDADSVRAAMWPAGADDTDDSPEVSPDTLRTYASHLRAALPPGCLPAAETAGYRLAPSVVCDWVLFRQLTASPGSPDERRRRLADALAMVRGEPFAGVAAGFYKWIPLEGWPATVTAAVTSAAHELAGLALEAGDHRTATWAAERGMLAEPYRELLHLDRLEAAAASSDRAAVEWVWQDIVDRLRPSSTSDVARRYRELRRRVET
jgi:DNA-binding SARP family transcriptional activator